LTNAETVALYLNGKLVESKPVDPYRMVEWRVPFTQGRLEAVAMRGGKEVARYAVETTGAPVALRLIPDRLTLAGDGRDTVPVTVEAVDKDGRPVPDSNVPVTFEIDGTGTILGVGNGDPTSHEPDQGNRRSLFNGLAQVLVRSSRGSSGRITLRARADGLTAAEVVLEVKSTPPVPALPAH